MTDALPPVSGLPAGWSARVPGADDVAALAQLVEAHQRLARGDASVDEEAVASSVTGTGSWTRRQLVLDGPDGAIGAWAWVHDRAAGRTVVDVTVAPDCEAGDELAGVLLKWAQGAGCELARLRELPETQLDASVYVGDERRQRWLTQAGYRKTRSWLHMSRPVVVADAGLPERPGVRVRRVAKHDDGLPVALDLQVVHQMLEESFADHFNSYRESFPEFVQRLREDPGHCWDHWWIAEIEVDGELRPGGALVSSMLSADDDGREGSYVDYIGVHRNARGRGVAKALLHTVIRDCLDRGGNRVDLEVDADSTTGADELYLSMGWATKYRTESWHATAQV